MRRACIVLIAAGLGMGPAGCHRKVVPAPQPTSTAPPPLPPSSMTHAPTLPPVPQPNTPKVGPPGSDQTAETPPTPAPAHHPHRARKKVTDPTAAAGAPAGTSTGTAPGSVSGSGAAPAAGPAAGTSAAAPVPAPAPAPTPTLGQLSAGSGTDSKERAAMNEEIRVQESRLTSIKRPLSGDAEALALQVRAFLAKARQAANDNDLDGARTLTTKAKVLLDELSSS